MSNIDTQQHTDLIYAEAADWLDLMSDGELDTWTKRRFLKWLDASQQNQEVFEAMLATWQDTAINTAFAKLKAEAPKTYQAPLSWRLGLVTAGFLLVAIVASWLTLPQQPDYPSLTITADTQSAQPTPLADGSTVQAQVSSSIKVNYSDSERALTIEKGQAYFSVAKDKQRPFIVSIDKASVTAVGTEFNIDRTEQFIDVTVYEGIVEVRNDPNNQPILLKAGEKVRIHNDGFGQIQRIALEQLVDWRSGWIEIDNETLAYLLEQLNRYSKQPIVANSAALKNKKVAGRFRLQDTEQALSLLSKMYALNIEHDPQQIRLTR